MNNILDNALTELDHELTKRDLNINIVICGAYAIHLLGYARSEHTLDVDSVTELASNEVKQLIEDVVISRTDLIKMKASAFSIRREQTNKDWEDLVLLNPTSEEIEEAIAFIKEINSPPPNASQKILADFQETIHDLKKIAK